MKSLKLKKLCAVLMAATISTSLFIGCGSDDKSTGTSGSGSTATTNQDLVFNLGEDPETIDPTLNTSSGAGTIIVNAFEGLMVLDENEQPKEAVAESMEVSEDGLVYTFKLREDAKWSDGEPVVADNFKYSWLRALDKATAAEYSYQLYYIKNAEKFYNGEVSADEVGINVIDEHTLEVTLESPTSYFPQLLAFPTYAPLREDIVTADPEGWATKVDTYISNGPFKLVKWDMKDQLVFERNENYWDASNVKLDTLTFKLVTDETTAYSELRAGNFDIVNSVPSNEIEPGKEEGLVQVVPKLGTYFFAANVGKQDTLSADVKKALGNKLVRQALNLVIDRQEIIDNVGKAEQIPAYSFVPQGIFNEDGSEFSDKEYYDPTDMDGNIEKAKELLKEAGYENGEGLPTFELMYNSEGQHKDICQIIQQNWNEIGVNVELTNQEWAVFLNTRQQGDYQISRHGWIGDYVDPMTFLDMWVTGGGNNDCGFSNAEYDKLVSDAKVETDAAKRIEMLRKAEDILMDEMPIFPIYYYTTVMAWNDNVKGVQVSTLGKVTFKNAYKE
ncbi:MULTISPECIES: peptide ABC transporter substrate-binding protein [unclassified Clostridium]|uniref:peptide ABC transporter substrate-binding protein n=1 Tax=unclassified Clostridium TaxID=2614128 RepID=UPI001C8C0422|nr:MULTISPECIES: peptide ABC transporter substrate-binding protein [unclassified Clostridium]MBX9136764.1 peptide ABC transporter substrate-binding protein [Clostridium sp. K12(2020)]MBX9143574.1 peptide ABC transporter substrate-binding protein [Clostridium sp. K13]MDU2288928.1 peptide ABC transporter substrate-binding protein [Clostridium celatum]